VKKFAILSIMVAGLVVLSNSAKAGGPQPPQPPQAPQPPQPPQPPSAPAPPLDIMLKTPFFTFPPQLAFVSNGKYEGSLQTQGLTLPITGTLAYLTGSIDYFKLHVSVDIGGQQITTDSWETITPTVINEWEIVSTDPRKCRKEVLSGDSYPQCTAWDETANETYSLECTITVQGNKATLDILTDLSADNKLVQQQEDTTIGGMTDSIAIMMTEQGNTPPIPGDFALPSICN